jgi:uncharacterized protein YndB with AHSA1/START domain
MSVVTIATPIEASAERVFALLADVERYREWNSFVGEVVSFSHSPLHAMSFFAARAGRRHTKWRVTAFDPPHRIVLTGKLALLGEVTVEAVVEPGAGSAVLIHIVTFRAMPGFLRPFGLLMEKLTVEARVRRALTESHAVAKKLLEPVAVGAGTEESA